MDWRDVRKMKRMNIIEKKKENYINVLIKCIFLLVQCPASHKMKSVLRFGLTCCSSNICVSDTLRERIYETINRQKLSEALTQEVAGS